MELDCHSRSTDVCILCGSLWARSVHIVRQFVARSVHIVRQYVGTICPAAQSCPIDLANPENTPPPGHGNSQLIQNSSTTSASACLLLLNERRIGRF